MVDKRTSGPVPARTTRRLPTSAAALVVAVVLGLPGPGWTAEITETVSALSPESRLDLSFSVGWAHQQKSAFIKRESASDASSGIELLKDLKYLQTRNLLNLRADLGLIWNIGVHLELPLVVNDDRSLEFDRSEGSACVFPGDPGGQPTCVNAENSTLLRDQVLPGYQQDQYGLDAAHARPFSAPSAQVFRGPTRRGLEYLGVGLTWSPISQRRRATLPTWVLTLDGRLDVSSAMRFDPARPSANTAVGRGYHEIVASTYISKRFRRLDPYVGAYYARPIRRDGGPFQKYPFGSQTALDPQSRAGVVLGVEQIAWEDPSVHGRVTVELRGRVEEVFAGRSQSELWEALSGSSSCATDVSQCRPGLDLDLDRDGRPDAHPGVTETQGYATFGGDAGLNVQVGRYARFRGLFGLTMAMPHFITFASPGKDLNGDGRVDVAGGSDEANPEYRDVVDLPGRRFRADGTRVWRLFVEGLIAF